MTRILLCLLFTSTSLHAEEWGLTFGAHATEAQSRVTGETISGRVGIRTGLLTSFFFNQNWKLRSGALYTQRWFDVNAAGVSHAHRWDSLDVPALLQFNATPVVGFYAGPVAACGKSILPIGQIGLNLIFDNMWGFDFFYEVSGTVDDDAARLSTYGISLVYYFL